METEFLNRNFRITKIITIISVGLFVFIFFLSVHAERLPIKTYNVSDGLPHGTVLSIYQDHKGFIWFGTFEGLSLFDGYNFVNFTEREGLPNSFINHITEDSQENLWIATNGGGITRLIDHPQENGENKFQSFKIREGISKEGDAANRVNRIYFDRNENLWCLTDWGLYRANVKEAELQFEAIFEKDSLDSNAIYEDSDSKTLWVGLADELIEVRNKQVINHGSIGGASEKNLITGIARDQKGRLLVSDQYNLFEFTKDSDSENLNDRSKRTLLQRKPNARIHSLFAEQSGVIWLATTGGLVKYTADNQSEYTNKNGLSVNDVQIVTRVHDGNLWIGTEGGGVCQLINEAIVSYSKDEGLEESVGEIIEGINGKFWAMQGQSVVELIGEKFILHEQIEQPLSARVAFVFGRYKGIWYRRVNGSTRIASPRLHLINGRTIDISYFLPNGTAEYSAVYEDEYGILWIAKSFGKIYRADTNKTGELVFEEITTDPAFSSSPWIIRDGKGGLWIGEKARIGRLQNGVFSVVKTSEGLPETDPRSFFVDSRGWFWIGSRYKGVSVTQEPGAENPTFTNYSYEQNQLSSNAVRSITEDNSGRIYFATDRGLDRFDPKKNLWTHFTIKDGLAGSTIYSVYKDRQGYIWAATESGLSRIDPQKEKGSKRNLPIYLSKVQIAGENFPLPETGTESIAPIELSSSSNNLMIEFVAPNFQNQDNVFYQYQLAGVDNDWSKPTKDRVVTYAQLASGEYRFLVQTTDKNGMNSVHLAVFEFRILPPIWRRWWFIALMSLLVALGIYSFYRNRLARYLEMERVRTHIATDLHDDIGANLTRISLLSEVAKQKAENGNDSLLSSIANIARESVASMNDIVWAISPEHDRLVDLIRRMRQHAEEVFTLREIELAFNPTLPDANIQLSEGIRRDVLLIFKEAVNNAVRHSACTRVVIDFSLEDHELHLIISDNGKGFEIDLENDGHGLRSMTRRALDLGGKLEIDSRKDAGTMVKLKLPLQKSKRFNFSSYTNK